MGLFIDTNILFRYSLILLTCTSTIDIVSRRLPTHTWRRRHMHETSKMASSTGQITRKFYYEKQGFRHFRQSKASNRA